MPPKKKAAPPPAAPPPGDMDAARSELQSRKASLQRRLAELDARQQPSRGGQNNDAVANKVLSALPTATKVPYDPTKTDVHWDYMLKEMAWLSADFRSERKRQISQAKKLGDAVLRYHATLETKKAREKAKAEAAVRRLAAKMGRAVDRGYWRKMERVVGYKQRLEGEMARRREMDKRLVFLVRRTERYGERLTKGVNGDNHGEEDGGGMTIEEALSQSMGRRRSASHPVDYTRMDREGSFTSPLYGESVARHTRAADVNDEVDGGYEPTNKELNEDAKDEEKEYASLLHSFGAMPKEEVKDEVDKLVEEKDMELEALVRRLMEEGQKEEEGPLVEVIDETPADGEAEEAVAEEAEETGRGMRSAKKRRVCFAPAPSEAVADTTRTTRSKGASSPLDEDDHDEQDEFHVEKDEVDDETTMEAEEKMGRDMSYEEEIDLLNRESEMSVEELRAMYANMDEGEGDADEGSDAAENDSEDEGTESQGDEENTAKGALSILDEDDNEEKDEFHVEKDEVDDETTMEAEERLGRDMSYQEEIDLLERENEMSVEELRAMYAGMDEGESTQADVDDDAPESASEKVRTRSRNRRGRSATEAVAALEENDNEEKDEFHLEKEEVDDETTMEAEEKLGRDMSYQEEIDLLERENEMSVEELRAMYANMNDGEDGDASSDEDAESSDQDEDETDASSEESSKRKRALPADSDDETSTAKKAKPGEDEGMAAMEALAASDTKARETMLTRPFLLASWVKLRAYQHIGLNWLVSIQSRRLNGILADEMGLGKTLQTISMLAYLASYKGIWGPHLIIVPTSCLVNWEVEFKRFCPGLKVLCYYGNAKRRKELRTGWTKPNVNHIVITSYQLAVQDAFAFKRKKWYYLILDEAHNIKNFESQRWQTLIGFNTQRRLLLTGTPLQNNLMELWSLLHFLMPHVFTDRKKFSYWFSNPMDSIIEGNAKRNEDLINRLHGIIRPFVLRRLKKDVETQLPGKYEHIVKCQLSRRQMFLYEEFMARSSTRKALQSGGNFMGMMNVLMQLRKVCNHPDLFEPRSVTTPFVMEPLAMTTAACVVNAVEPKSALERVSPFLRLRLWTMGRGMPSFESSTSMDPILAGQLSEIKTPRSAIINRVSDDDLVEPAPRPDMDGGLSSFLSQIRSAEKYDRLARAQFTSDVNAQRCEGRAFPYSDRMCRAVSVESSLGDLPLRDELSALQIAATPMDLLAMRKSQEQRASDLDDIVDKFVFCVPRAGTHKPVLFSSNANSASATAERALMAKTAPAFERYFAPFKRAESRLTMCLPDKKLVQFDAGKLQTLATLLRELKHGGHRVLIFTQMSKMLDVLEAFLNLNGHTYLRLDGATDVERRQRLMDRFNNDPKVFCFILSTRSGGLGINLTGADTVVFYDSDWNPAMDAQAQDRAHRIGQTREVHIYRMVTEHSIEENILTKAKQKRNLDFLVMDEGKFHATAPEKAEKVDEGAEAEADGDCTFTKGKLQNILGIQAEPEEDKSSNDGPMSKDQLESAMTALEDEDDVKAMHSARQEAAEALQEFDDKQDDNQPDEAKAPKPSKKRPSNASLDSSESDNPKAKDDAASDDDKEMEKEFAQWQRKVGMDSNAIRESLNPLERYGLYIKEQIDPFYSQYFWAEQQRLAQTKSVDDELDIEEIEQKKVEEEQKAFEDGDLLATFPEPESLPRQRQLYIREKARLRAQIMKRKLTGQNWVMKIEERSGKSFWYNADTGEALWGKPEVLKMLEAEEVARAEGWAALPSKPLVKIFEYLFPYPERTKCEATCRKWRIAANDPSFVLHVWPVEHGALVMDESKLGKNHFRTIADAMQAALPGDTIELGDGHYFINEPGLVVDKPVKFVGDENEPSHVILELSGEIVWKSHGGWMEGLTIRRPRIAIGVTTSSNTLRIESGGRLDMYNCVFDPCVSVAGDAGGIWEKASITGSKGRSCLILEPNAKVELIECDVGDNHVPPPSVDTEPSLMKEASVALPLIASH